MDCFALIALLALLVLLALLAVLALLACEHVCNCRVHPCFCRCAVVDGASGCVFRLDARSSFGF